MQPRTDVFFRNTRILFSTNTNNENEKQQFRSNFSLLFFTKPFYHVVRDSEFKTSDFFRSPEKPLLLQKDSVCCIIINKIRLKILKHKYEKQ